MSRVVNIHGQGRYLNGEPVGEIFVDTAGGPTMAVVVRADSDGMLRVEVYSPSEDLPVGVLVNDVRVHETLPI